MFRQVRLVCVSALIVMMTWSSSSVRAQVGGDLDVTFGSGGKVLLNFGVAFPEEARATVVQPDGKILVAGHSASRFTVARVDANGVPDESFGNGGVAFVSFAGGRELRAMFLQDDGKIVLAGQLTDAIGGNVVTSLVVARFDQNGQLDTTFGSGGTIRAPLGTDVEDFPSIVIRFRITAVAALADGGFVVAGTRERIAFGVGVTEQLVARYDAVGSTNLLLDGGFGTGGIVTTPIGQSVAPTAVMVQPDDAKIVVTGTALISGTVNFAVTRYRVSGMLDAAFGDNGLALTDIQGGDQAFGALLESNGNILVVGRAGDDIALVRYLSDGRRDPSFGSDGKVVTDIDDSVDEAAAVQIDPDGNIVVAGSTRQSAFGPADFFVARYTAAGVPDTIFGDNGVVVTDIRGSDEALAVAVQADGKVIAAGIADKVEQEDFAIVRYERGTIADLAIAKVASVSTVNIGESFTYALTVSNRGRDAATNVVVRDRIPAGLTFVACAASGGICGEDGGVRTITFAAIGAGETRTATLTVSLNATVADGVSVQNVASVASEAVDPNLADNTSAATIVARNVPHTLRLFLHGMDIPGTAGGFTMNATPAAAQAIRLNLANAPAWFSDPALTGTVLAGGTFRVIRPCTLGLGLGVTYRLAATDAAGGSVRVLGQTQRLLAPCIGQEVISIPIATPVSFANERLRLTISSSVQLNLDLQLGEGTRFEVSRFAGLP